MQTFLKIYLPIYLLFYLLVAFILPTYKTWKQTGINPVTFGKEDTAHNYIGFVMKLLIVLLFLMTVIHSLSPDIYDYLLPAWYMKNKFILILGLVLIHISLIWIFIAQHQMSNNWRIGIDEANKTSLVTRGVFSISRNPIFLGMIVTVFGLFLVLPNALSFFLACTSFLIIQIQIRLEEEFLEKQHGQLYNQYKSKTRRLI